MRPDYFVPGLLVGFLCGLICVDPVLSLLWYWLLVTVMEIGVRLQKKEPIGPEILWATVLFLAGVGVLKLFVF